MVLQMGRFPWARRVSVELVLVVLFGLALALRVSFFHIETSDYSFFLSQWYTYIQAHGGLAALKDNFSNYNTPYLTLLALMSYLPVSPLIAVKALSVVFDGVLALFVYLILRLKYQRALAALAGALVLLYTPTIVINSSAWGQCDAIYVSFCLGSLYFLLKRRAGWACVFFALALAFKLQAVFFAPVLFVLLLKRWLPLRYLVLIPLVFALMLTPALLAGRSAGSLLCIYVQQVSGGDGGNTLNNGTGQIFTGNNGSTGNTGQFNRGEPGIFQRGQNAPGQSNTNGPSGTGAGNGAGSLNGGGMVRTGSSSSLTLNAPSFYQWLPADAPAGIWQWVGIALAGLFILVLSVLLPVSKQPLTTPLVLKIALTFALAIPFLLPEMHERYFYLADAISIVYAFFFLRSFYIAVIVQLCSLLSYTPYLQQTPFIPLAYVAGAELLVLMLVCVDLVRALYARPERDQPGEAVPEPPLMNAVAE